ncbi:MAG: serine--tRNA ligase [Halobacteria archaeon]
MLSMDKFREDPGEIKESEKRRDKDPGKVDRVVEIDEEWRDARQRADDLRHEKNELSQEIGQKKREGETAESLISRVNQIKEEIADLEDLEEQLEEERDDLRYEIGNILHPSVPKGEDEEDNVEVNLVGEKPQKGFDVVPHADAVEELGMVDTGKASEVTGSRFYYLKNELVALNLALQRFALDRLTEKGFTPMQTPYMLGDDAMTAAAELEDFEEQLYSVDDDTYLIATSEQTLGSYHFDEILEPKALPLKYAGVSSCFRREAGSHGKDTKGIFRVHRFEKVEQYVFCEPENSWEIFEELRKNFEEIFEELDLHYRIVNVCTGDMNDSAAKKYDLEAWFPAQDRYRELVSCSNCTDYQARKLKVRIRGEDNRTAHTLNSTALACQRTICAILEQNQREDGSVVVPEVLRDYVGFEVIEPVETAEDEVDEEE